MREGWKTGQRKARECFLCGFEGQGVKYGQPTIPSLILICQLREHTQVAEENKTNIFSQFYSSYAEEVLST